MNQIIQTEYKKGLINKRGHMVATKNLRKEN